MESIINYICKGKMFDSAYPTTNKKGYSEDITYLPTAEKSQFRYESESYLERTPDRMPFGSPMRKSSRVSEARKSIDECIYLASEKKKMNEEAIGEVQQINSEIINSLTGFNPAKTGYFEARNKTAEPYRREDPRDYIATSQFDWRPSSPIPTPQEEFKQSYKENSISQENVNLRSRLNEEIKKNNDLLKYVTSLETELSSLKGSRFGNPAGASGNFNEVLEENRHLKRQLASSQGNAPYNLI